MVPAQVGTLGWNTSVGRRLSEVGWTWSLNTGPVLALLGQNTKHQRYRDRVTTIGSKVAVAAKNDLFQSKLAGQ